MLYKELKDTATYENAVMVEIYDKNGKEIPETVSDADLNDCEVIDVSAMGNTLVIDLDYPKTKTMSFSVQCSAIYGASLEIPADMSYEDAVRYAQEHLVKVPLAELEYITDSDILLEDTIVIE